MYLHTLLARIAHNLYSASQEYMVTRNTPGLKTKFLVIFNKNSNAGSNVGWFG